MVVPHYVYLVLKIPMEQGILTLCANVSTAYECEREGLVITEAMDLSARMEACIANSKKVHTYKAMTRPVSYRLCNQDDIDTPNS